MKPHKENLRISLKHENHTKYSLYSPPCVNKILNPTQTNRQTRRKSKSKPNHTNPTTQHTHTTGKLKSPHSAGTPTFGTAIIIGNVHVAALSYLSQLIYQT